MTLIAIWDVQVLRARLQRLGITRRQHLHVTLEYHLAVDFKLRHDAVGGIIQLSVLRITVIPIQIGLLVVRCQQLRFGIDTTPVIRQRQIDRRFQVNTRCFRHVVIGIDEMDRLAINTGIKRTDVILVVVDV